MSAGGGQSQSSSTSMSDALSLAQGFSAGETGGQSKTFVDPAQQGYLDLLRSTGADQLGGGQAGVDAAAFAGGEALSGATQANAALMDPSSQIAAQQASLQSGLGSLFRDEINPAIEGASLASGGFGGGRQGVAQGVATTGIADAFTRGLGDITARANAQAGQAIGRAPTLAGAGVDLAGAGSIFGQNQLGRFASMLGGPTVLSRSSQFGRNQSQNQAISESRSRAAGSSEAYDFDFGWDI